MLKPLAGDANIADFAVSDLRWQKPEPVGYLQEVHLVAIPEAEDSLARGIGEAHRRYTRLKNFSEGVRGYLFQGRFGSWILDQRHLLGSNRYYVPGKSSKAWDTVGHGRAQDTKGIPEYRKSPVRNSFRRAICGLACGDNRP